jgi:hypothetical protein
MYATFKKNILQMSLCDENRPSYIIKGKPES